VPIKGVIYLIQENTLKRFIEHINYTLTTLETLIIPKGSIKQKVDYTLKAY
jgi:hypothetical protein